MGELRCPPSGATLFAGIYSAARVGEVDAGWIDPLHDKPGAALTTSTLDLYATTLLEILKPYIGCLSIDWGVGMRSWVQRTDRQNKEIAELTRVFREDEFPGYTHFIAHVSEVETMPLGWIAALKAAKGVYLLSSVRTKEQYVGSAIWGSRRAGSEGGSPNARPQGVSRQRNTRCAKPNGHFAQLRGHGAKVRCEVKGEAGFQFDPCRFDRDQCPVGGCRQQSKPFKEVPMFDLLTTYFPEFAAAAILLFMVVVGGAGIEQIVRDRSK